MSEHLLSAGATLLIAFVASVLGQAVLRALKIRAGIAPSLAVGLLSSLAVFSTLIAKTWTMPLALSLVLLAGAVVERSRRASPSLASWRELLWSALGASALAGFFTLLLSFEFTGLHGQLLRSPAQRDSPHFVVLARFMSDFGLEAPGTNWLDPAASIHAPYHYADLWLAVLVHKLTNVSWGAAYLCLAQGLLLTLAVLVVAACARVVSRLSVFVLIGVSVFAVGPGLTPLTSLISTIANRVHLDKLLGGLDEYTLSPGLVGKILPAVIVVAFAVLAGSRKPTRAFAWWLVGAMPLVYFTLLPFSGALLATRLALALWRREWSMVFTLLRVGGALTVAFGIEFMVAGGPAVFFAGSSAVVVSLKDRLVGTAKVLVGGGVRIAFLLAMAGLLFRLALGRRRTFIAGWGLPLAVGLVGSLGAWSLVQRSLDSWQLLTVVSGACFVIVVAALLARLLSRIRQPRLQLTAALAFAMVGIGWTHWQWSRTAATDDALVSASFIIDAQALVAEHGNEPVLWLRDATGFKEVWDYNLSARVHPALFRVFDAPRVVIVPLGDFHFDEGLEGQRAQGLSIRAPIFTALRRSPGIALTADEVLRALGDIRFGYVLLEQGVTLEALPSLAGRLGSCVNTGVDGARLCGWKY